MKRHSLFVFFGHMITAQASSGRDTVLGSMLLRAFVLPVASYAIFSIRASGVFSVHDAERKT